MGSPITFSGFNSIDFSTILNAVMQQERTPLTALETRKSTLETQNTTFGTLLAKMGALETAVKDLGEATSLATLTASSSDAGVGVSTTSGTVEGSYDVVVSQLARAQVTASTSTYSSVDAEVATTGTLSLLRSNQPPVEIVVTASMTLQQLADAINASADAPVNASVVQAAPGSYRLVLTGRSTGADHAFTIVSTLSGGEGVTFADGGTPNGVYGEAGDGNTQEARNAAFTVNGLPIASAGNVVSDVVPGVTLTLSQEDPARTATVTVKRDTAKSAETIEKFVTAYNDLLTFYKDQNTAAIAGKPNIGRDPVLRGLRDALRTVMQDEYPGTGSYGRLSTVGVEIDSTGKLKLNKTKLEEALKASPADVQKLFSGADGESGAFGAMRTLLAEYTKSGGIVATVRQNLGDQVSNISKRLDTMEARLAARRVALQQEYIAADMAMTQMKSQSSSLSAIGAQYRLF
jgi:flagellar hook-associated protein 2